LEILSNPVSKHLTKLRANMTNILVGVELETQKFENMTWHGLYNLREPEDTLIPVFNARLHEIPVASFSPNNSAALGSRLFPLLPKLKAPAFFEKLLLGFEWTSGDLDREHARWSPSTTDTGEVLSSALLLGSPTLVGGVLRAPVEYMLPDMPKKGKAYICIPEPIFIDLLHHALNNGVFSVREVVQLLQSLYEDEAASAFYRECFGQYCIDHKSPKTIHRVRQEIEDLCGLAVGVNQDGSVDGPEFQFPCECGAPPNAVKTALDRFLKTYSIVVDRECSFHIHISSEGMRVGGGAIYTQFLMLKFLSDNAERFPRCVMERVVKGMGVEATSEYYDFQLREGEKHLFVADRIHTWEFRCFGNVKTMKDANICIDLAIDAFLWAHHPDVREEFEDYKHGVGKLFNLCHLLRVNMLERFKKILKGAK